MTLFEYTSKEEKEIFEEITYQGDGPVNEFGAMCRAINLAQVTNYKQQDIAEALNKAIKCIRENDGELPSKEY